jgi:hypothetical protein
MLNMSTATVRRRAILFNATRRCAVGRFSPNNARHPSFKFGGLIVGCMAVLEWRRNFRPAQILSSTPGGGFDTAIVCLNFAG